MGNGQKVVARYKDGSLVKGYARNFRGDTETVKLLHPKAGTEKSVPLDDLKAIFFVKTFKGYRDYVERKAFGMRKSGGRKVYVRFSDRESLLGFIDGEIPWERGFSLAKLGDKTKGFFLVPTDSNSNNNRIFVVGSAIKDITIMVV